MSLCLVRLQSHYLWNERDGRVQAKHSRDVNPDVPVGSVCARVCRAVQRVGEAFVSPGERGHLNGAAQATVAATSLLLHPGQTLLPHHLTKGDHAFPRQRG